MRLPTTIILLSLTILFVSLSQGLNNGLALTPPMGWLSWERFRCNVDCQEDEDDCINESLYLTMSDAMIKKGFLSAGYNFVNIDDCYLATERAKDGRLQVNVTRFPHGIAWLADQLHQKGMKLGIYEDVGTETCMYYPGIGNHTELDAETFAEWGVDGLKLDGCFADPIEMDTLYPKMSQALLNQTRRGGPAILYACSWPDYQRLDNIPINWPKISENCNYWRLFDDIQDSWDSVSSIIEFWGQFGPQLSSHAGPGHWNDPDMLLIGDFSLSFEESKTQFAFWALFAAPLFISADIRSMEDWQEKILLNKEIIAVNQDPLGIQGTRFYENDDGDELWQKQMSDGSFAVILYNSNDDGVPHRIEANFDSFQIGSPTGLLYRVRDLYLQEEMGNFTSRYTAKVNVHGVVMLRVWPYPA